MTPVSIALSEHFIEQVRQKILLRARLFSDKAENAPATRIELIGFAGRHSKALGYVAHRSMGHRELVEDLTVGPRVFLAPPGEELNFLRNSIERWDRTGPWVSTKLTVACETDGEHYRKLFPNDHRVLTELHRLQVLLGNMIFQQEKSKAKKDFAEGMYYKIGGLIGELVGY